MPSIQTGSRKIVCNVTSNAWTDEARQAAIEARRAKSGGLARENYKGFGRSFGTRSGLDESYAQSAQRATDKAKSSGSSKDHKLAAIAHKNAAREYGDLSKQSHAVGKTTSGNEYASMREYHSQMTKWHMSKASKGQ